MSLDTQKKRGSVINLGMPGRPWLTYPDNDLTDVGSRLSVLGLYAGTVTSSSATPTTPVEFTNFSGRIIVPIKVDANYGGDNPLVTAGAGQTIRVLAIHLLAGGSVTLTWKSATTAISGPMPMIAGRPYQSKAVVSRRVVSPLMSCNRGENLVMALSADVAVGGHLLVELTSF